MSDESTDGDRVACDDERRALFYMIRPEGEDENEAQSEDVDGDCKELGICGTVAEFFYHGWDGCRESGGRRLGLERFLLLDTKRCWEFDLPVYSYGVSPEDDDCTPYLPVLESGEYEPFVDLIGIRDAPMSGSRL